MTFYVLDLATETIYDDHTSAVAAQTQAIEMGPEYVAAEGIARVGDGEESS